MRVICFGDSNTYGYDPCSVFGGRYPADSRWVDVLAVKTGWEVINAGQNGREIPGREAELHQLGQTLLAQPIDLLIVMLGTNDLLQGAGANAAAARMGSFLNQLTIEKEKILLIAPPPMKPGEWVQEENLVVSSVEYAQSCRALALGCGVGFADAGEWGVSIAYDGVHFTESGHRAFAAGLYEFLLAPGT